MQELDLVIAGAEGVTEENVPILAVNARYTQQAQIEQTRSVIENRLTFSAATR